MAETDGKIGGGLSSLPRRASQRIVRDFRHDIQGAKQKGSDIIPTALILFIEKWLGFWATVIFLTLTVGVPGMAVVYSAEMGSKISALSSTVPWLLGHIWMVGLLIVLTYGVMLFSLFLVSVVRLMLWSRDTYFKFWNRNTPSFKTDTSEGESKQWPPKDQQLQEAREHAWDYLGNGAILFSGILFLLFLLEQFATETLYQLLSSSHLAVVGNSISLGIGVLDFNSALSTAAPDATQTEIVLFVLFFVIPASVMTVGTRNLLYIIEARIRTQIDDIRKGNLVSWSTAFLLFMFLYTIGICANILVEGALRSRGEPKSQIPSR